MSKPIERYVNDADLQAVITETARRLNARLKISDFEARVAGLSLSVLTRASYDTLTPKDPDTIYFVLEITGDVVAYKGEARIVGERELVFSTRFEFPSVGDPTRLYIATDERMSYYFDESQLAYVAIGTQLDNISQISGGNASTFK